MGADVFCTACDARVDNPRAHVDSHLHDRFEVRLASGGRVSLGDAGVDAVVAAEQEQRFVETERESVANWQRIRAQHDEMLAAWRSSVEQVTAELARLGSEIVALNESIGALDRERPQLEAADRQARAAVDAAKKLARAEVVGGPVLKGLKDMTGRTLTEKQAIEYCVATHWLVWRAEGDATKAVHAMYDHRERRAKQARRLADLAVYRAELEASQPERQQSLDLWEGIVAQDKYDETMQLARRLAAPREKLTVQGSALRQAQVRRAVKQFQEQHR